MFQFSAVALFSLLFQPDKNSLVSAQRFQNSAPAFQQETKPFGGSLKTPSGSFSKFSICFIGNSTFFNEVLF